MPRCWVIRKSGLIIALAAVAPSATTSRGSTSATSASSQGRQALMCVTWGVAWILRFPRSVKRKCLTALVT